MRAAYLGNFSVPYSTESHVAASLEHLGHTVLRVQEGEVSPQLAAASAIDFDADMFLWTQTYGLAESCGTAADRSDMLSLLRKDGIPSAGFHLDRWWGLGREAQVSEEPFFRCDYVFTADGGHDDEWSRLGINHHWLPPGVYHAEAYDGVPRREFSCKVVFVGSWRHYGHEEWWPTRRAMLKFLDRRYRDNFRKFPRRQAVRGTALTDLYASCKVAVGDSCLVGNPIRYWSDRIPETLGRGALLIHPEVEGLSEVHPFLPTYPSGDLNALGDLIDRYLANNDVREQARIANATHTRENHTYAHRMETVIQEVLG